MKRSTPKKSDLSAVVVAAGQSRRFRQSLENNSENSAGNNAKSDFEARSLDTQSFRSKALIELNGRPLIEQTLERLACCLPLQEIVLVVSQSDLSRFSEIVAHLRLQPYQPRISLCIGGDSRQDSVRRGLEALTAVERVCIHDGARPFVSTELLHRLNEASLLYPAAVPALPMVDTVKEIAANGSIVRTHDRSRLVRIQTPQFFRWREILDAHLSLSRGADRQTTEFTDDAALFEALGLTVMTVAGEASNIKVTTIDDLPYRSPTNLC